ncbi:MAG TPA: type VI secretion system protein TssL, long form [Geminicoccaceae bacterium]|nr:type VI secretion system protein TssL, long form [Geminicoccaceae bacterium]
MSEQDPFGLYRDADRTVVTRPTPGGRPVPGAMPGAVPAAAPLPAAPLGELTHPSRNPLMAAGASLLSLASQLRRPDPPASPEALRQSVLARLQRFGPEAARLGASREAAQMGAWALAALMDDVVLNTPWGRHSSWPSQTLCGTIYKEVDAGERFYDRLAELEREPGRHKDVLELMYACLAMGFEGRYRVPQRTGSTLSELKDGLYRLLKGIAPAGPAELSPHWQGTAVALEPPPRIPLWAVGAGALLLVLMLWTGFSYRLGTYTDGLGPLVQSVPPTVPVSLVRAVEAPPPPPPNLPLALLPRYQSLLAAEIRDGRVAAEETATALILRLRNQGLFASGSADVAEAYLPLLDRLGRALDEEAGRILVVGHSDSTPIRRSPRFPSNWELSKARAEAVAALLRRQLGDPRRLAVDGRADTEPLASNATEAGRAANRRVEILLLKGG